MFPSLSFSSWVSGNTNCLAHFPLLHTPSPHIIFAGHLQNSTFCSNVRVALMLFAIVPKISWKCFMKDDIMQISDLTVSATETCKINKLFNFWVWNSCVFSLFSLQTESDNMPQCTQLFSGLNIMPAILSACWGTPWLGSLESRKVWGCEAQFQGWSALVQPSKARMFVMYKPYLGW